jgi:hypothetical protein
MHRIMRDVAVQLPGDRPGTLASAFTALAKAGLNVDGFTEVDGTLHVLTGDAALTRRALESVALHVVRDEEVVVIEVNDRPGVAANIFRELGDAKVNVTFTYIAANNRLAIGVSNILKAQETITRAVAVV